MRRIKDINPRLYKEILNLEADLYSEMNDKMNELKEVKDMVLAYDPQEARSMLSLFKKKNRLKARST